MSERTAGRLGLHDAPSLRPGTARATYQDRLLLGHERVGQVIAVDPVSSILIAGLNGLTSLGELAEEVSDAGDLQISTARSFVLSLAEHLESMGFIVGALPDGVQPRRVDVRVSVDSCLGQRWGLSRARTLQVSGNDGFRISCSLPELLDPVEQLLSKENELDEPDYELMDTIHLRAVRGRVDRTQLLFDTLDPLWYAGRSFDRAVESFLRTIEGRLRMRAGGAWLGGPSVERDGRVVLIHPSLWDTVTSVPALRALHAGGCELTVGGLLWTDGERLQLPGDRFAGTADRELMAVGIANPRAFGPIEYVRQALHLLRWWDGSGFRAVAKLAPGLPTVELGDASPAALGTAIAGHMDRHGAGGPLPNA